MRGFPFNSFGVFRPFPHKRPAAPARILPVKARRAAMKRRLVRPALLNRGGLPASL